MLIRTAIFLTLIAMPANAANDKCLAADEARVVTQAEKLIEIGEATRLAKARQPGDVIAANLCRVNNRLMYVLAIMAREGRVNRIGVDAQSRAVLELR